MAVGEKKITELTVGTVLADADVLPVVQSGETKQFTALSVNAYINNKIDSLTTQTALTDTMTMLIRSGGSSLKTTMAILRTFVNDSNKPSYKNIVIKNNSGSPTDTIDVDFDELQIGKLREESYTPQSITLASDLDTGSPALSTMYYIHARSGIGQTTICQFSTSATTPAALAGYTESRCISGVYNDGSGLLSIFRQIDDNYVLDTHVIIGTGNTFAAIYDADLSTTVPYLIAKTISCGSFYADASAGSSTSVATYIRDELDNVVSYSTSATALASHSAQASISQCNVSTLTGHVGIQTYTLSGGGAVQNGAAYCFGCTIKL